MQTKLLKWIFGISLTANVLLLTFLSIYLIKNKEKLTQKLILSIGATDIVMFGDSHTANARWNSLLENYRVVKYGFGGFTSDQLRNMMMINVLPVKTRYCFIQCGGNDLNNRCFDEDVLIMNIREMIDSLQIRSIKPVLQSLFYRVDASEYNARVDSINFMLKILSDEEKIFFVNVNDHLIDKNGLNPEYTLEGVHLNQKGNEAWAKVIGDFLDSTDSLKRD